MRTIVIGDIHGCLIEFTELIETLKPASDDQVWLLGDLVDRGPDSAGVVDLAMQKGFHLIKGNHDDKHVRYRRHLRKQAADPAYVNPMAPGVAFLAVHQTLSDDALAWMASAQLVASPLPGWILVHAGLRPHENLKRPLKPMNLRFIDKVTGEPLRVGDSQAKPESGIHWSEGWPGPQRVIYGHHAQPDIVHTSLTFGIDTGLVYGGRLTAAVIEDTAPQESPTFIQVPARKAYYPMTRWDWDEEE